MIQPAEAKERYGFRDATEREDVLTMTLLNSVQAVQKSGVVRVAERLMPLIVLGLCAAVGIYTLRNGVHLAMIALPLCMLLVYLPQIKDVFSRKKEAATIAHDADELGTHFLVAFATCLDKQEKSVLAGAVYSMKVRLQSGEELEDVLLIRDFYQRIQPGQKLFVAMADSPQAKQFIGIAPAYYDVKVIRDKGAGEQPSERPDSRKLRRITDQERILCADYYAAMRKKMLREQQLNRSLVFLIPAAIFAAIAAPLDRAAPMSLALVLVASYLFSFLSDVFEIRSTVKALKSGQDLFVMDAQVSAKPVLVSKDRGSRGKTQAIDFRDSAGKLVHRSTRSEDWKNLDIGDSVLLIYLGKKRPLACRKTEALSPSGD